MLIGLADCCNATRVYAPYTMLIALHDITLFNIVLLPAEVAHGYSNLMVRSFPGDCVESHAPKYRGDILFSYQLSS